MADQSELVAAVRASAARLGISPSDLLTAIDFETGGTLSPSSRFESRHSGTMLGLIQFDPENQKKYGVRPDQSVTEQMGAVENYLRDRGLKPGMGMLDLYSTINAGRPGLYDRSDTANGGTPGTVADKVATQMVGARARANSLLGDESSPSPISPSALGGATTSAAPGSTAAPAAVQTDGETPFSSSAASSPVTSPDPTAIASSLSKLFQKPPGPAPAPIDIPQPIGLPAAQRLAAIMQRLQVSNGSI